MMKQGANQHQRRDRSLKRFVCLLLCAVMMLGALPAANAEESQDIAVPFIYENAYSFSEGLAAVQKDGKWGYIDRTGNVVIPFQYDQVDYNGFEEGVTIAVIDGKVGLIDKQGKNITAFQYDSFVNGGFIKGMVKVEKDGKVGIIDQTGKEVVPPVYDSVFDLNVIDVYRDESVIYLSVRENGKIGFLDHTGKEIVKPQYDDIGYFFNGMLEVKNGGKIGFLDTSLNEVIPPRFEETDYFSPELAVVAENGRHFFIDKTGKEVPPPEKYYSEVQYFNGLARIYARSFEDDKSKYGFMDEAGTEVVKPVYDSASHFTEVVAAVERNGQWGVIDRSGKVVIPLQYEDINVQSEHFIAAKKGGKYAFFDGEGRKLTDFLYSSVSNFKVNGGFATVMKDGLYGFVDGSGKEVWKPQFQSTTGWVTEGLAAVQSGDRWGFIAMPYEPSVSTPETPEQSKELKVETANPSMTLMENSSAAIRAKASVEGAKLVYSSSDEWVAAVSSDGTITARRPGTAVISIQAKKDGYQDGYGTVFVTVTGLKALNLKVEPGVLILRQGETKKIATDLPDKAKLEATVANRDTAAVEINGVNGKITGGTPGDTLVTFKASMEGYKEGTAAVNVIVAGDLANVEQTLANWSERLRAIPEQDKNTRNIREAVASEAEQLIASLVKRQLDRVNGEYVIEKSTLSAMADELKRVSGLADKQISDAGIVTDRGINLALTLGLDGRNEDEGIRVRLDKEAVQGLQGVDLLYLQFAPFGAVVGLDVGAIDALFAERSSIDIVVEKDREAFHIRFLDAAGNELPAFPQNMTIVLPVDRGNPYTASVFLQGEGSITHIGGSYDAYNEGISIQTKSGGSYYVGNESKSYRDMTGKDEEMKQAVDFLSSKGIISGITDNTFEPDAMLTRAQFVTMLVRSFYALDQAAKADFKDVKDTDWFHDYVASSQKERIVLGMDDGTFRPSENITKEQMAAVISRSMVNKRKYAYPDNEMDYLAFIQDRNQVSEWARTEVALAIKERMFEISEDSRFAPQSYVTRGEAARTLYRLFLKLY